MNIIHNVSIEELVKGLFDLFPNMYVMIATLIGAVVLSFLIKKLVWNPVMKLMKERADLMDQELQDAKHARLEALEYEKEAKEKVNLATIKSSEIISEAKSESNQLRFEITTKANDEAKRIITDANSEIAMAKKRLAGEVKKEIVDVAFEAAEKIVEKNIDKSEKDILDDFVSKLNESK